MSKEFHEDHGATPEEHALLLHHGFHAVRGLEGAWQRGSVGADGPLKPKLYTLAEALKKIREERNES